MKKFQLPPCPRFFVPHSDAQGKLNGLAWVMSHLWDPWLYHTRWKTPFPQGKWGHQEEGQIHSGQTKVTGVLVESALSKTNMGLVLPRPFTIYVTLVMWNFFLHLSNENCHGFFLIVSQGINELMCTYVSGKVPETKYANENMFKKWKVMHQNWGVSSLMMNGEK